MPETNTLISDQLKEKVEEFAREQKREPADVVEEALVKYLANRRLERFAEKMEHRARTKGIREEDIPRLVDEVRHQKGSDTR